MKEVIWATDILKMNMMDQRLVNYRVLVRDILGIPLHLMWVVSPPVKGLANLSRDIMNKWKGQTPEPNEAEQSAYEHVVRLQQELRKRALLANQLDDAGDNLRRVTRVAGRSVRLFDEDSGPGVTPRVQGHQVTNPETGSTRFEWNVIRGQTQRGMERLWVSFKTQRAAFVDDNKTHFTQLSGPEYDYVWNICKDRNSPVVWAIKWKPVKAKFFGTPGYGKRNTLTRHIIAEGRTPEDPGAIFVSPDQNNLLEKTRDVGRSPFWDFNDLPEHLINLLNIVRDTPEEQESDAGGPRSVA